MTLSDCFSASKRALGALAIVALPAVSDAQVALVDWASDTGGLFSEGANWQDGAAPDVQLDQAPRFQTTTEQTVQLPTSAPLEFASLWAESAEGAALGFEPADVSTDAHWALSGQTTIAGGRVEARTIGVGDTAGVHLMTESLVLTGDGDLQLEGQSRLTTGSVEIHSGESTPTELLLQSASHELGEVSIGEQGEGSRDANLQIELGGQATAGNVSVGAVASPDQTALLQLAASSLVQDAVARLTVGSATDGAAARVFLFSGSQLETGGGVTSIAKSGEIRNLASTVHFRGPLTISGGQYVENAAAQRSFAPGSHIEVHAGGLIDLGEEDLLLDQGRSLTLTGDESLVQMDGDLVLGASSTIDLTFDAYAPDDALIRVGCDQQCTGDAVARLAGTLRVDFNPGQIPQLGVTFPIIRAAGFAGEFTPVEVDPPAPGQVWELAAEGDTLWLSLVEGGLAGDYNGDGVVDVADYASWRDSLGSQTNLAADGDGDGAVGAGDYAVWRNAFLAATSVAPSPAPEPGALPCSLIASAAIVATRRRFA